MTLPHVTEMDMSAAYAKELARSAIFTDGARRQVDELRGSLLASFWGLYAPEVRLAPVPSRLWVNPPPKLAAPVGYSYTLTTQRWLAWTYGAKVVDGVPANGAGTDHGFVSDVAVFWDYRVHPDHVTRHLIPESTLTLVFPGYKSQPWTQDLALDPTAGLVQAVEREFKLAKLSYVEGEFDVVLLGVEAK